jgi:uncharacterized membrane protein
MNGGSDMTFLNRTLIVLHLLGLAMGFAGSIGSLVMLRLMKSATPQDKAVLGRVPKVMGKVGSYGIALLWATGLTLVYTRWGGFGSLPWTFHVKLTAVVIVTAAVGASHAVAARVNRGDAAAAAWLPAIGAIGLTAATIAVIFAVVTFT